MVELKIKLEKLSDVNDFVNEVSKLNCEADLSSGRYIVNAGSIMGIFALNTFEPMTLKIYDDNENLKNNFKKWEVK